MRALKKELGGFVLTERVEHGTGQLNHHGIAGLNSADFTQCRLSRRDSAFTHIEFCKVRPGSRMIAV